MTRWLREPLLHFLVLGGLILALDRAATPSAVIEVPARVRASGDAARYVEDEALVREALRRGLHERDEIVRRRLVQKMRFILDELAVVPEPDEAALEAWLKGHADRYAAPARLTLRHAFFRREPGRDPWARAQAAASALAGGEPPAGDPFLHGARLANWTEDELARALGDAFAAEVAALEPGSWSEPIASSHGVHRVLVEARTPARAPALAEVRARVLEEVVTARRQQAARAAIDALIADARIVEAP
ncbi:MAG: peptidyl-prolyl cis-trans isomerase [Myxococcales bacterium]|nr:peptidyl-prolyl cis-trans isomerase [Myxococcales bacterium]